MPSETVVLDSKDLPAIIADATGEPAPPEKPTPVVPRAKTASTEGAPAATPSLGAPVPAASQEADGLTEEERKTYTEKMRKSVAWRHGKMREAQELAQREKLGRTAAEERARALEAEVAELRARPAAPAATVKEPQPADFQSAEEYMAARVKWEVASELAKERAAVEQRAVQAERARIEKAAKARIAKAIELVPDFADITGAADFQVPPHLGSYLQESELFAELGYFFAQHPEEMERLAALSPQRGLVELGKIESKLQPFGEPARGAPKVEPHGGSSQPSTDTDGNPSKPRVSVPVIQPLNARGAPEVEESSSLNGRQALSAYERRTGHNLSRRQRH